MGRGSSACATAISRREPNGWIGCDAPHGVDMTFAQDLRSALRQFASAPSFTLVAVATLAIGIGATTAIFSAVNAVVLAPLPIADPDRVVAIGERWQVRFGSVSPGNFNDWRTHASSFSDIAAASLTNFTL